MRIIFDRSSFHGDRFQTLASSPLRGLVKSGQIRVFLTPVLLQETIDTYGVEHRAGPEWREHLRFVAEICNGGVFLPAFEIWRNELLSRHGSPARYVFPDRRTRRYHGRSRADALEQIRLVANTADLDQPWQAGATERQDTYQKKENQRASYAHLRCNVEDALRGKSRAPQTWPEYREAGFESVGRQLMKRIDEPNQRALGDMWAHAPERYPFYSAFAEGLTYALFHAAENRNDKIDPNSQADFEQLAYLTQVDAVVSDDERFFRQAFDAIWRNSAKRTFTAREFATFAQKIQR